MPGGNWTAEVRIAERSSGLSLGLGDSKYVQVELVGRPVIERIADAEGLYTTAKASDGSLVEVSLAGTDAKQGDKIHMRWGTVTYDQVLTKSDIAAGHVTVGMPADQLLAHGAGKDFSVTVQIIGKGGAIGALSTPYEVVINHVADTRDPNLITSLKESFFGTDADDVVVMQVRGDEYFQGASLGIHGGGGIDTLKLIAGVADYITVGAGFSSMEIIDMGAVVQYTSRQLHLNLSDVLRNGSTNAFYEGSEDRVQMMIKGTNSATHSHLLRLTDALIGGLDVDGSTSGLGGDLGNWASAGIVTIGGVRYTSYKHSSVNAEVLVQTGGVTVSVLNRAEFIEAGAKALRSTYALDSAVDEEGSFETTLQSTASLESGKAAQISSLLMQAEPELFPASGGLLSGSGVTDQSIVGAPHPAQGFSPDMLDSNHVSYMAY